MEEAILAVLSALAEVLFEVFFQVVLESIIALIARSIRNLFEESNAINPILAAAGYLLFGVGFGIASLRVFPYPVFPRSRFHGVSLVVSPVITGLVMSQVGAVIRRKGKETVRIESFGYGFTFAFGWAIIRFLCLK